jgi:CheY-like chemotaxis protein
MLRSHDIFVELAHTGMDAVRKARFGVFDIVLVDYRLPDIDGVAVARIIRTLDGPGTPPRLVAMTAAVRDVTARSSDRYQGFDALIGKPFTVATLMAKIHQCRTMAAPFPDVVRAMDDDDFSAASASTLAGRLAGARGGAQKKNPPTRSLVVDDDGPLRSILRLALQSEGHEVECAANGLEALRKMQTSRFDVALIDYQMPELDGLATAKLVYDLISEPDRPRLVALTGAVDVMMMSDPDYGVLFDEVVTKAQGIPAMLLAVRRSLEYRTMRAGCVAVGLPGINALPF